MSNDGKAVDDISGVRERSAEHGAAGGGAWPATMQEIGGSSFDAFNALIARQVTGALYANPQIEDDLRTKASAALAALMSIAPRSELEGMLAAQMVACHNAAMECFRRAAHPGQRDPARDENLAHAARLSRSYAALVEALDRRRGEGVPKTVTVEHRITRVESAREDSAPRLAAPHAPASHPVASHPVAHKGNGHALNGHKAANGTALR